MRTYGVLFFHILIITVTLTEVTHIVRIFQLKYRTTKSDIRYQKFMDLLLVLVCLTIFIIIIIIIIILRETEKKVMQKIIKTTAMHYQIFSECFSDIIYYVTVIYTLVLQIACGTQLFCGRNFSIKFNEAKHISNSMLISTSLTLVSILVKRNISTTSIQSLLLLEACVIRSTSFAILVSRHGFRVVVIIFRPEKNTSRAFEKSSWAANSKIIKNT